MVVFIWELPQNLLNSGLGIILICPDSIRDTVTLDDFLESEKRIFFLISGHIESPSEKGHESREIARVIQKCFFLIPRSTKHQFVKPMEI